MMDQLQSIALYLSKSYPLAALPLWIEKLKPVHPELANLLHHEYTYLLPLQLSEHQHQQLRDVFPTYFSSQKHHLSLRDCYTHPHTPPEVLRYLEHLYTQHHGLETAYRQIEAALSRIRAWEALRDYYLRYLRCSPRPHSLYQETRQKALLLCLRLAPHPTHALQLLLDWLNYPHPPHPFQLAQALHTFYSYGWYEHITHLLEVIATQELHTPVAEQYHQLLKKTRDPLFSLREQHLHPALTALEQQTEARHQADRYESQRLLIKAARQYGPQEQHREDAILCWCQLLQDNPSDPNVWHVLYDSLIPTRQWNVLDGVLSRISVPARPLPTSSRLLPLFLQALHQKKLPSTDPLPFFVQAWQQDPKHDEWFTFLVNVLTQRQQWHTLQYLTQIHLGALEDPLHVQEVLLQFLHQYEELSCPLEQLISLGLMALSFHPKNRHLIVKLTHWSQQLPPEHSLHRILHQLAQEGWGSQSFQMQCPPPQTIVPLAQAGSSTSSYERMLQQNPHHVEAIHRIRQTALQQRDFDKALTLYEKELDLQSTTAVRAFLLRSMGELLHYYLKRPHDALLHFRTAQQLIPPDPDLLFSLAELHEHLRDYRSLVEVLQTLLPLLSSPQHHPPLLRKLVRVALDPLRDYAVATRALSSLLLYHPPVTHSLDLIHHMNRIPAARIPLLTLLYEREKDLPGPEIPYLQLEICRNLFLQQRDGDARDRLQILIDNPATPDALLQQAQALAAQNLAWPEMMLCLQRRIQRLEQHPHPHVDLAELHAELGDLLQQNQPNHPQVLVHYRYAYLFAPHNPTIFERLRAQLYERGAFAELQILLQKQAPHILNHKMAAAAYTQLALLEHRFGHSQEALLHLQQAHRLDRESSPIAQLLRTWNSGSPTW